MTRQEQHKSSRTQRREAERLARKLAHKEAQRQTAAGLAPEPSAPAPAPANAPQAESEPLPQPKPISEAQLAANRANARLSTGAKTAQGQARSSRNALKTGLTGKTVLLPDEDADAYEEDLQGFIETYGATTDEELRLVKTAVDCMWRLDRITRLETSILFKGQLEANGQYADRTAIERAHLVNADVYLKYERQLRNLYIQEARLRRTLEKTQKALAEAQSERLARQEMQLKYAERQQAQAKATTKANGFEFSDTPANPTTAPQPSHSPRQAHA